MASVEELCDEISLINQSRVLLNGSVSQIKKDYSKRAYKLNINGSMMGFTNAMWTNFELVEKESHGDDHSCIIQLLDGASVNDLLKIAVDHVNVHSVNEVIPSMNEIFIEVVNTENEKDG
jgi:ABC-2 type transport system ATP-binding protein